MNKARDTGNGVAGLFSCLSFMPLYGRAIFALSGGALHIEA